MFRINPTRPVLTRKTNYPYYLNPLPNTLILLLLHNPDAKKKKNVTKFNLCYKL